MLVNEHLRQRSLPLPHYPSGPLKVTIPTLQVQEQEQVQVQGQVLPITPVARPPTGPIPLHCALMDQAHVGKAP